jgi:hypothetical protein
MGRGGNPPAEGVIPARDAFRDNLAEHHGDRRFFTHESLDDRKRCENFRFCA